MPRILVELDNYFREVDNYSAASGRSLETWNRRNNFAFVGFWWRLGVAISRKIVEQPCLGPIGYGVLYYLVW